VFYLLKGGVHRVSWQTPVQHARRGLLMATILEPRSRDSSCQGKPRADRHAPRTGRRGRRAAVPPGPSLPGSCVPIRRCTSHSDPDRDSWPSFSSVIRDLWHMRQTLPSTR
jgi:hypothetical protein